MRKYLTNILVNKYEVDQKIMRKNKNYVSKSKQSFEYSKPLFYDFMKYNHFRDKTNNN